VRHARFDIATVAIEQVPVPMKAGYLLVAESDDGDHPQWEALVYALDAAPVAQGRYRVDISTLDGRVLGGDAVLVRSVEGTHVLRGAGPLEGIVDADLDRG
jgi:hypothetical protein